MDNPLTDPPQLDWPAPLMTAAEVAAVLRITPNTVRLHIHRGSLRALRIDGSGPYRVRAEDVQEWAERQVEDARDGIAAVDRHAPDRAQAQLGPTTSGGPGLGMSRKPDMRSVEMRRRGRRDGTALVTYRVRWTGPTARAGDRRRLDRRAALIAEGPAARARMAVRDCYEQWMREHVRPQRAARTVRNYEGFWARHLRERIGSTLAIDVRPRDVKELFGDLLGRGTGVENRAEEPPGPRARLCARARARHRRRQPSRAGAQAEAAPRRIPPKPQRAGGGRRSR
jgi:excisionase family DNA binding protein